MSVNRKNKSCILCMLVSLFLKSKGSTLKYVFRNLKFDMLNSIENRMKLKIDFMHTSWNSMMLLFSFSTCYKLNGPLKRDEYYVFQNKKRQVIQNCKCISTLPFNAFHVIRNFLYYINSNDMVCNIQGIRDL